MEGYENEKVVLAMRARSHCRLSGLSRAPRCWSGVGCQAGVLALGRAIW